MKNEKSLIIIINYMQPAHKLTCIAPHTQMSRKSYIKVCGEVHLGRLPNKCKDGLDE